MKIAGALLLGAVIGGVIGVLFAPAKGSDTRQKLAELFDALTDQLNDPEKNTAQNNSDPEESRPV